MIHLLAALSAQNKRLVQSINERYTQEELGLMAEDKWVWCSYPQPESKSFLMRATKIVGDNVLLEGSFFEWNNMWHESTSCMVPLNTLTLEGE